MALATLPTNVNESRRIGTVIAVNLPQAVARVRVGGEEEGMGFDTGWLAFSAPRAGETRCWLPPSVGEQVEILLVDGDYESAHIGPAFYSDEHPAPSDKPGGMILWSDDAVIEYDPVAHKLEVTLPDGGEIILTGPGMVTINATGGLTINGDVTLNGTLTSNQDVVASGKSLKSHKHSGVQAGAAQSGPPA